ncbi:putative cytochrome b561 isoform X4 [Diaphorina citri]|uniref:Cytochrome b561 isoform X4 n=1 Tax=Diaphorina citri TaxID=121845 RepID=A0A3Q0JEC1_DIACI|nr:putative cytochrome b561 isoform X4 [Diaphorina citri]
MAMNGQELNSRSTQATDSKMAGHQVEDLRGFNPIFYFSQAVGAAIVVLVSIWTIHHRGGFTWRSNPGLEFNWHPLLMTIGLVYLGGNVNLIYRSLRNYGKKGLKLSHACLHGVILILVLFGLVAAFDSHNFAVPPKPNLYTLHSWIGLLTVILYCSQYVVGFISFMYPGIADALRGVLMPYHVFCGVSIFIMSSCAVLTGLLEKAIFTFKDYASSGEGFLMNFIGLLVILYTILIGYLLHKPSYKRSYRAKNN